MIKPNTSLENTSKYLVFSDSDTFEGLDSGAAVILVDGDHDLNGDGVMQDFMQTFDASYDENQDPLVPIEVSTDDVPLCTVRVLSVDFLLRHYLRTRTK